MQQWTDLFLNMPLPESWMKALLFITFGLHLLFVLLMLGTALLSRAESLAHQSGLGILKLYASVNSEKFYLLNGYTPLGDAVLPLNPSVGIECRLMRKFLADCV